MGSIVTGLEQFSGDILPALRGMNVGLLTHPCGIDRAMTSSIDVIAKLDFVNLVALFGPEHGIRGEVQAGDHVGTDTDLATGLPIHSLYGETRVPTPEMLTGIDALIVDLQDVGVRYATYFSTLDNVLRACSEHGKRVIVLDRPNPLGGSVIAGGLLDERYRSFVGSHSVPVLHGMTLGELALLLASERGYAAPAVIPMEGWSRSTLWDDTGLPWVPPAPNLPTLDTHLAYPGTCLIEGTNLSEGRGTTRPFEWIGAPWIDPWDFAAAIDRSIQESSISDSAIAVRPLYFTPVFSKHAGERCGGVHVYVDRSALATVTHLGVLMLQTLIQLYPQDFRWLEPPKAGSRYFIDLLTGSDRVRTLLDNREETDPLFLAWREESAMFEHRRGPFLLYDAD